MRYVIVTGGVISGIGKGITSSSIALLFQSMGYVVSMIKIDPYLNVDAGTMSPYEHGECYVLGDGGECDLDLGNYERFLNVNLTRNHNITTGRIYANVIQKERNGEYLGATVQVVPHITDEIMDQISKTSRLPITTSEDPDCKPIDNKQPDICIIEVGGTIGDIEGLPFIESLQQMRSQSGDTFCFIHVAMAINNPEPKTKPIQHSISTLRSRGIFPDLLVIRASEILPEEVKQKIQRLCQIDTKDIISNPNVSHIYEVPGVFNDQNICTRIGNRLNLPVKQIQNPYSNVIKYYSEPGPSVRIAIVGKYITNGTTTKSPDTYLSLYRSIEHAAISLNIKVSIDWLDSENIHLESLSKHNGFIIPGGFGSRGITGKLSVAKFARKNKIPLLGICLGMQIMVVEYYNTFCGVKGCSREWVDIMSVPEYDIRYVIDILPDQNGIMGGTMRLGNYTTTLSDSRVLSYYNSDTIVERHRHRYEVNNKFVSVLEESGLKFVGRSINRNDPSQELMEVIELPDHPYYVGCQFHPEYKSRYENPHPLFVQLLKACFQ